MYLTGLDEQEYPLPEDYLYSSYSDLTEISLTPFPAPPFAVTALPAPLLLVYSMNMSSRPMAAEWKAKDHMIQCGAIRINCLPYSEARGRSYSGYAFID